MKCSQSCANEASHTFYRLHHDPINVCDAHLYVSKSTLKEGEYMVKPLTLEAHLEDYEKNRQPEEQAIIVTEFRNGGTKKVISVEWQGKEVPFYEANGRIYWGNDLQPSDNKPTTGNSEAQ